MTMLRVEIFHRLTGHSEELLVRESPARVGRYSLSEVLVHERSVSLHHGQLTFDATNVWYVDLGSSNGTKLDGVPLPHHTLIPLSSGQELDVGPLTLRVTRAHEPRTWRGAPDKWADEAVTSVTFLDVGHDALADTDDPWPSLEATAIAGNAIQLLQHFRVTLAAIASYRSAYVEALREQLDALPLAVRGPVFGQLTREFPELLQMTEFEGHRPVGFPPPLPVGRLQ